MKKKWMLHILGLALTLTVVALSSCVGNTPVGMGVLEGKASIGPRSTEEIGQAYPSEVYQPRKIMVYDAGHVQLIKQVDLDEKGYYRVELPPGTYVIDINYVESDRSNAVPRKLEVEAGQSLMLDVDFNTEAASLSMDYIRAVQNISSSAIGLTIKAYTSDRQILVNKERPEFGSIIDYVKGSKLTWSQPRFVENDAKKTEVAIPYAIAFVLEFPLSDGSSIVFDYGTDQLWFNTKETIYSASVEPGLYQILDKLVKE